MFLNTHKYTFKTFYKRVYTAAHAKPLHLLLISLNMGTGKLPVQKWENKSFA